MKQIVSHKNVGQKPVLRKSRVAICVASLTMAGGGIAAPEGADVVHGSASFSQSGNQLDITNSDGTIINWQDFSIANDEVVQFIQENAQSSVLNRVTSGIPSDILGDLSSNGRVFLINPNGIVIGEGARIDTASFVASTLAISDQDYIDGNLNFSGDSGAIENHGYIAAGPNGDVVLIAPDIENHGLIRADDGRILLAAGREVTLHSLSNDGISFRVSAPGDKVLNIGELVASNGSVKAFADQVFNQGRISANRAYRNADGNIVLEADDRIDISGEITVSGEGVKAGNLHILGDQVDVRGAHLDASGEGGGEILIGGDFQGQGSVKNALNTNVDAATRIRADAGLQGDGGRVIVWSDNTTNAFGEITARGGRLGGDGGFVETSGKVTLNFGVPVDVSAVDGEAGTWLLDPEDIVIGESEADAISTSLNNGSNVEVKTSDEGDGEGNISVNAPITKTEGDSAVTLTLDAHNRVDINAPITTSAGPLNLTIKTGRQVASADPADESMADQNDETPTDNDPAPQDDAVEQDAVAVTESEDESQGDTSEDAGTESETANASNADAQTDDGMPQEGDSEDTDDNMVADSDDQSHNADDQQDEQSSGDEQADASDNADQNDVADIDPDSPNDDASEGADNDVGSEADNTDVAATEQGDASEGASPDDNGGDHSSDMSSSDDNAAEGVAGADQAAPPSSESESSSDQDQPVSVPDTEEQAVDQAESVAAETVTANTQPADQESPVANSTAPVSNVDDNSGSSPGVDSEANEQSSNNDIAEQEQTSSAPPSEVAGNDNTTSGFIEVDDQQIVIAADIDTGGGELIVDAGADGDVVVLASVDTSDAQEENAGDITLQGERIALDDGAKVDASANNAGEIKIGGGLQGQDESVRNADAVVITDNAQVSADGGETGDGGRVIVFSEQASIITGNLSARGGTQSGNGGFIETSGLRGLTIEGTPDITAENGDGGEWLIDPANITIASDVNTTGVDPADNTSPWTVTTTTQDAVISTFDIATALVGGGTVTISTTSSNGNDLEQAGNIYFTGSLNPFISEYGVDLSGELTLNADNDIIFTGQIDTLVDGGPSADGTLGDLDITFNARNEIQLFDDDDMAQSDFLIEMIRTSGNVTLNAENGDINSAIQIITDIPANVTDPEPNEGGQISFTANNGSVTIDTPPSNLRFRPAIIAGDGISVEASQDITINTSLEAEAGTIDLNAGQNIDLNNDIETAQQGINLMAAGDIDINASVRAGRDGVGEAGSPLPTINITANSDGDDDGGIVRIADEGRFLTINAETRIDNSSERFIGGDVNISGSGVDIETAGCSYGECSSSIRIRGLNINIDDDQASTSSSDITISANADLDEFGGSIRIEADGALNINASGDLNISTADSSELFVYSEPGSSTTEVLESSQPFNQVNIRSFGATNIEVDDLTVNTGIGEGSSVTIATEPTYINGSSDLRSDSLTITASTISVDASDSLSVTENNSTYTVLDGGVEFIGHAGVAIDTRGNLEFAGNAVVDQTVANAGAGREFNTSIRTYGDLAINVGSSSDNIESTLRLEAAEIVVDSAFDPDTGTAIDAGEAGNLDQINTENLVINRSRISSNRAFSSSSAPGGLRLTTTGSDSTIDGVASNTNTNYGDFALRLESVDWQQEGIVYWQSGTLEISNAYGYLSDASTPVYAVASNFDNSGTFNANSENGDFIFTVDPTSVVTDNTYLPGTSVAIDNEGILGTINNTGTFRKTPNNNLLDSGTGETNIIANLDNSGTLSAQAGDLIFVGGDINQTAGVTELYGGDLRLQEATDSNDIVVGGTFRSTGGTIRGGISIEGYGPGIYTGGTLEASLVTVEGTTIDPGFSPGQLTINGDFDASAGNNTFMFDVNYDATNGSSANDLLLITGDANIPVNGLNGTNEAQVDASLSGLPDPIDGFVYVATVVSANTGSIEDLLFNGNSSVDALDENGNTPYLTYGGFAGGAGDTFNVIFEAAADEPPMDEPPMEEPPMEEPPMEEHRQWTNRRWTNRRWTNRQWTNLQWTNRPLLVSQHHQWGQHQCHLRHRR